MAGIAAAVAKQRAVAEGLGTNENAVKYLNQDFDALRNQCLQSGVLFKDEEFPACPSIVGYQDLGPRSPKTQGIAWKRPPEICPNPQFIVGGATRTDIRQGALGDCWLMAAIASLTLDQDILSRVVPENQSFQKSYAGVFHFQIWQYGEWVDVVIDDRLPTKNGQLMFVHSEEGNEFWSALLEKAYAKLNGSYEALTGGSTIEGFEDLTGGISEFYDLNKAPADLFSILQKALKAESLIGCSIDITNAYETEAITSQKLVKGHAYSLTGAEEKIAVELVPFITRAVNHSLSEALMLASLDRSSHPLASQPPPEPHFRSSLCCCFPGLGFRREARSGASASRSRTVDPVQAQIGAVNYRGRPVKIVRVRNPWGEVEWTGPWSDEAPEWNYVDPKVKQTLDKQSNDGEFWMAYTDFLKQYSRVEICNLSPDTLSSDERHKWNTTLFNGSWKRGATAGGCQNNPATFWTNPQFKIKLDDPDHDHSGGSQEPCCTVLVGLMQKNRRKQKKIGEDLLSIGYSLFRIPKELQNQTEVHLNRDFFMKNQAVARSDTYINLREVSKRIKLPVGEYLIVPSTFEPFKDGEFCLRVFSEKPSKALEIGDVVKAKPYEPHESDPIDDNEFKTLFHKLTGQDNEMTAVELQTLLNRILSKRADIKADGFTLSCCREMISLLDDRGTGTLDVAEFKILWQKIQKYMHIYKKADTDRSGTIDAHEIRTALTDSGFTLNNQIQQIIITRYASDDLLIDFDGFVSCMIRLETLFKMFKMMDKAGSGTINLSLPEWLCCTLI